MMGCYVIHLAGALLHEEEVALQVVAVGRPCVLRKVALNQHIIQKILKSAPELAMQRVHLTRVWFYAVVDRILHQNPDACLAGSVWRPYPPGPV